MSNETKIEEVKDSLLFSIQEELEFIAIVSNDRSTINNSIKKIEKNINQAFAQLTQTPEQKIQEVLDGVTWFEGIKIDK